MWAYANFHNHLNGFGSFKSISSDAFKDMPENSVLLYLVFVNHTQFSIPDTFSHWTLRNLKSSSRHIILLNVPSEPSCTMWNFINLELNVIAFRQGQSRGIHRKKEARTPKYRGTWRYWTNIAHLQERIGLKRYLNHLKPLCMKKPIGEFTGFGEELWFLHHSCIVRRW